jgi:hypothetical protein
MMRNEIEVMRVVRIPPMGKLVVQIGNQRLKSLAEARDDSARRRLLTAIGELIVFAGGYETLVEAGVAPPLLPSVPGAGAGSEELKEETLTPEQEAFLASLEEELKATIESSPPPATSTIEEVEVQLDAPAIPAEEQAPLNLVGEINEILQKYLADDPSLRHRSIHLEQPNAGALLIRVDQKQYHHPREIEEDNVREALKKALQEWESR